MGFSENVVSPQMAMVYWEKPSRDPCKNTRVDLLLKVSPPGPSSNLLIRTGPGASEGNPRVPGRGKTTGHSPCADQRGVSLLDL